MGVYLFFAIVATVVIVLLLHEALEDEPLDEGGRTSRVAGHPAPAETYNDVAAPAMNPEKPRGGESCKPSPAPRVKPAMTTRKPLAIVLSTIAPAATSATGGGVTEWLPWIVLGAIALLVAGIALRMFIAARFPKGYSAWARSRRETFAERNAQWDEDDKGP